MPSHKITRLAPAKLNLMLHIVGRLPSGLHHLQTLIAFADYGDVLTFSKNDQVSVTLDGGVLDPVDNSVVQAVQWLQGTMGVEAGVAVHLEKRLPIAAGLGGGSSDAAAVIAALLDLWGIVLSRAEKEQLVINSSALGADVPVCLAQQLGLGKVFWVDGSGKGRVPDVVATPGLESLGLLLVNPGIPLSTAEVFALYQGGGRAKQKKPQLITEMDLRGKSNDLLPAAVQLCPDIKVILEALERVPEGIAAGLSGSGATCFLVLSSMEEAAHAVERMRAQWPMGFVQAARFL